MPSGLPSGPPSGKGLSVPQEDRPALQTYSKPENDVRDPKPDSESIFHVEFPDDLGKEDQPVPDRRRVDVDPRYTSPGKSVSPKTRAPYRDGLPHSKLAWRYYQERKEEEHDADV